MNERKTENIVRNHFNKFSDNCFIEEQSSSIPKIDKLLKSASKKGTGKGYPEFIISFPNNQNFIILIECKGDIRKHESNNRDKYAEYAVDGILLYASFLSKEFDVLAIAVSGQNVRELKVSHFLHLKGENKATSKFSNKLLDLDSYMQGYSQSPEKIRQDLDALRKYSNKLNEDLEHNRILASDRSLLISSILIALDDKTFRKAYQAYEQPDELAKFLVDTVSNVLRKANLKSENIDNLATQFSFIRTDTALSKIQGVLQDLIENVDKHINSFIETHEYYDVLGQLYIEFLRYANSDKGLGIVLTPPI
jgi:hypothetical protein